MATRPLRLYKHAFVNREKRIDIVRVGETPCAAKRRAFEALEQQLAATPELPRTGWRLLQQQDVTALAERPPNHGE